MPLSLDRIGANSKSGNLPEIKKSHLSAALSMFVLLKYPLLYQPRQSLWKFGKIRNIQIGLFVDILDRFLISTDRAGNRFDTLLLVFLYDLLYISLPYHRRKEYQGDLAVRRRQ